MTQKMKKYTIQMRKGKKIDTSIHTTIKEPRIKSLDLTGMLLVSSVLSKETICAFEIDSKIKNGRLALIFKSQ